MNTSEKDTISDHSKKGSEEFPEPFILKCTSDWYKNGGNFMDEILNKDERFRYMLLTGCALTVSTILATGVEMQRISGQAMNSCKLNIWQLFITVLMKTRNHSGLPLMKSMNLKNLCVIIHISDFGRIGN